MINYYQDASSHRSTLHSPAAHQNRNQSSSVLTCPLFSSARAHICFPKATDREEIIQLTLKVIHTSRTEGVGGCFLWVEGGMKKKNLVTVIRLLIERQSDLRQVPGKEVLSEAGPCPLELEQHSVYLPTSKIHIPQKTKWGEPVIKAIWAGLWLQMKLRWKPNPQCSSLLGARDFSGCLSVHLVHLSSDVALRFCGEGAW